MVFPSFVFLLCFLPALLLLYYFVLRGNLQQQNILLLIASLFFYSWGEPVFVFAMLVCVGINWAFGCVCIYLGEQATICGINSVTLRKIALILTIMPDLSLLIYYKYASFAVVNINRLLATEIPVPNIALPIGISFFTFQAISYTLDIFRGKITPEKKLSYVESTPQVKHCTTEAKSEKIWYNKCKVKSEKGRKSLHLGC